MHFIKYISKQHLNDKVVCFNFERPKNFTYLAGQFVELSLRHVGADERGENRWFSLSSAPHEPALSITTRIDADPLSSFKTSLLNLTPGSIDVSISEPMGDFVLPRNDQLPLIFIVAGIGIAPVRGVIAAAKNANRSPQSYLWYAVADKNDIVFKEEITSFFSQHHIVSGTRKINDKKNSRLALEDIKSSLQPSTYDKGLFYIAGPDHFVGYLKKQFETNGVDQGRLIADYFGNYKTI